MTKITQITVYELISSADIIYLHRIS